MTLYRWHYDNIPSHWKSILERLKKFEVLTQQINKAKKDQKTDSSGTLKTFYTHHNELIADTRALLGDTSTHSDDETLDTAFVEAVWLSLEHYPALVHHPAIENLDTAGSKTFRLFTPDAPAAADKQDKLKSELQHAFNLDSEALSQLTETLGYTDESTSPSASNYAECRNSF